MPPHTEDDAVQEALLLDAIAQARRGMLALVTADAQAAYLMCYP